MVGAAQVLLEVGDFVSVLVQLALSLVFVDREVEAELFEDLNGSLGLQSFELRGNFTGSASKYLELFAHEEVLEVRDLTDELFEENTASLDKLGIVVVGHLHVADIDGHSGLLGDGWDVAAGPALSQHTSQRLELIESALAGPLASIVTPCHRVLRHLANLDRITHRVSQTLLLSLVLVVLGTALDLLTLAVVG